MGPCVFIPQVSSARNRNRTQKKRYAPSADVKVSSLTTNSSGVLGQARATTSKSITTATASRTECLRNQRSALGLGDFHVLVNSDAEFAAQNIEFLRCQRTKMISNTIETGTGA
jgi:hypothetical protein